MMAQKLPNLPIKQTCNDFRTHDFPKLTASFLPSKFPGCKKTMQKKIHRFFSLHRNYGSSKMEK